MATHMTYHSALVSYKLKMIENTKKNSGAESKLALVYGRTQIKNGLPLEEKDFTHSRETESNRRPKDDWRREAYRYSPPLYQLSYHG